MSEKTKTKIIGKLLVTLVILTSIMITGCDVKMQIPEAVSQKIDRRFEVVIIDSCEYVVFDEVHGYAGSGGITHKGNCKFCKMRNK